MSNPVSKLKALNGKTVTIQKLSTIQKELAKSPVTKELSKKLYTSLKNAKANGYTSLKLSLTKATLKELEQAEFDYKYVKHDEEGNLLFGVEELTQQEAHELGALDGLGSTSRKSTYKLVTDKLINLMEGKEDLFWRKEWNGNKYSGQSGLPRNYITNKIYRGVNLWMLMLTKEHHTTDWLTIKQIKERGGELKPKAQAYPVCFFIKPKITKVVNEEGKEEMNISSGGMMHYFVYNLADTKGVKPINRNEEIPDIDPIESCENIVKMMPKKPPITNDGGDRAYYVPSRDSVHMPIPQSFNNLQSYYATLFHELVHSTGHRTRLARETILNPTKFGSKDYAVEELVAELGASFLCAEAGILYFTLKNSAAYLRGWKQTCLKYMKEDSKFFFKAASQAQRAADFMLSQKLKKEREDKKKSTKKKDPVKKNPEPKEFFPGQKFQVLKDGVLNVKKGFTFTIDEIKDSRIWVKLESYTISTFKRLIEDGVIALYVPPKPRTPKEKVKKPEPPNPIVKEENKEADFKSKWKIEPKQLLEDYKAMGRYGDLEKAYNSLLDTEIESKQYIELTKDVLLYANRNKIKIRPKLYVDSEIKEIEVFPYKFTIPKQSGFETLKEMVGKDDFRPAMKGVYFDKGKMIATDAHVLVIVEQKETDQEILSKAEVKYFNYFKKTLPSFTRKEASNYIKDNTGGKLKNKIVHFFEGSIIDQKYPDYNAVIPTQFTFESDELNIQNFVSLIESSMNIYENITPPEMYRVLLQFGDYYGFYNPSNLMRVIKVLAANGPSKFKIKYVAENKPLIIKSGNNLGLVMPVMNSIHDPGNHSKIEVEGRIISQIKKEKVFAGFSGVAKQLSFSFNSKKKALGEVENIDVKPELPRPSESKGVVSAEQLAKMEYESLPFTGQWFDFIGLPPTNFKAIIYGQPGFGKSTLMLRFANYIKQFGKTLFATSEEFGAASLSEKIKRLNVKGVDFAGNIQGIDLSQYQFVFLDSINDMGMNLKDFKELKLKYPNTAFILILQSTKSGSFKGGQEWPHEVEIQIEGFKNSEGQSIAKIIKNRYLHKDSTGEFDVFG